MKAWVVSIGFCWITLLPAQQHRVDLRSTYERLLCVVPMVGAGTAADPRRPLFAPLPGAQTAQQGRRSGIIAFTSLPSDDGRFALVEFVAVDRSAFQAILAEAGLNLNVKVFEKGKAKRADIEAEFRKYRKDIDLDKFGARVP